MLFVWISPPTVHVFSFSKRLMASPAALVTLNSRLCHLDSTTTISLLSDGQLYDISDKLVTRV